MTKLSLAQRQAIDPQLSCWVEASAGTGKTKVLVDRVLVLLLCGTEAGKILCLTFTKAAAAEMRERIQERLELWSRCNVYELRQELASLLDKDLEDQHLKRARSLFGMIMKKEEVKIQTVHAFCQFLLKSFPLEAGLMPHFQIMGDQQIHHIKKSIFQEVLKAATPAEMDLLVSYVSLSQLEDIFLYNQEFAGSAFSPHPTSQLSDYLMHLLGVDLSKSAIHLKKKFLETYHLGAPSAAALKKMGTPKIEKELKIIEAIQRPLDDKLREWEEYILLFLTAQQTIRKKIVSNAFELEFPEFSKEVQQYAHQLYECTQQLKKHTIAELSLCIYRLGTLYRDLYEKFKRKHSCVDYEDLIEKSIDLLKVADYKPWIFYKLEGGIDHVLIDEAQDTSRSQWIFIRHLIEEFFAPHADTADNRTLFVVGDSKQSIYSFQGADPLTFQEMKEFFGTLVTQAGKKWKLIDLSTSYRSTEAILKCVDRVFTDHPLLHTSVQNLPYKPHELHRGGEGGRLELWPLMTSTEASVQRNRWEIPTPALLPETARYKLAHSIADTIAGWLEQKTWLLSKNRPIQPQDIMILVRHRDIFLHDLVRALKHKNIPVSGMDRLVLTEELVVQDLLAIADFCLLPSDDLMLATVLKGPLFACSEEDLLTIARDRGEISLWERLEGLPQFEKIYQQLVSFQQLANLNSPSVFYGTILSQYEGRQKLINRLGSEVEDIIEEFLNSCLQFEEQEGLSLQKFQFWMKQNTWEVKRQLAQSSYNQVRLMTVHGAKGLQAPIVFLPDTTQVSTNKSSLYWPKEKGDFPLWIPTSDLKTGVDSIIQDTQDLQEYYRLLYVAMTRAEDQLYICGWDSKKGVDERSWYAILQKTLESMGQPVESPQKGKIWVYETLHTIANSEKPILNQNDRQLELVLLPDWIKQPFAKREEEIITPSMATEESRIPDSLESLKARQKGILIHEILQWVLQAHPQERLTLVKKYLDKKNDLPIDKPSIEKTVEKVLSHPEWHRYLDVNSLREVPIEGWKDGKKVRGIIDLLTIEPETKQIFIIDYKTGIFAEDYWQNPPEAYVQQLGLYASVLHDIYPDYTIHKVILWTEPGILQTI